jgi:hypothetical protein
VNGDEDQQALRGCGFELLELSGIYDGAFFPDGAGPEARSIAGLVARQRRLLRAAYTLRDNDLRLEAQIIHRTMLEFSIRQRWLQLDAQLNYLLWAIDDVEERFRLHRQVREQAQQQEGQAFDVMAPQTITSLECFLEELRAKLAEIQQERGLERAPSYPDSKRQADVVGLGLAYALAYRFDSQTAAHPSVFAATELFREQSGGLELVDGPDGEAGVFVDTYGVCAFILYDALDHAGEQVGDLRLEGLDDVGRRLVELAPHADLRGGLGEALADD